MGAQHKAGESRDRTCDPGLQGEWFIHYTTVAIRCNFQMRQNFLAQISIQCHLFR